MARNGYYRVKVTDEAYKERWEIRAAAGSHTCWGGERITPSGGRLNIHAAGCSGTIRPPELYLIRPDHRDVRIGWHVCMYCAVEFHEDALISEDFAEWRHITEEDVEASQKQLKRSLVELHNMDVPGGVYLSLKPIEDSTKHYWGD